MNIVLGPDGPQHNSTPEPAAARPEAARRIMRADVQGRARQTGRASVPQPRLSHR